MIVVTGGAGFIGSCFVWRLNEAGITDILVVDEDGLKPPKTYNLQRKKVTDYMDKRDFLKDLEKGRFAGKLDGIIHMGACSDTTEKDEDYLRENNFHYSQAMAKFCLKEAKKLIYASSAATYGDGAFGYSDEHAKCLPLKPLNLYGESKQVFDLWALENHYADKFTGIKFFNVYGPNEYHKGEMRSVVHKGCFQIKKEGKIRLFKSYRPDYGDGAQKRDFVYIKDAVEVMWWFWQNQKVGGIYNLGTGNAETWNELALSLFEALNMKPNIEYIEMPESIRNQYQYWTQADLKKLRSAGFNKPFRPLREGVRDYVREHLEKADPYL